MVSMHYFYCFILQIIHTTHRTFFFYTLPSASFRYILRNTPETFYRAVKTAPDTKHFSAPILTNADHSQVITKLSRRCPLSTKCPENSKINISTLTLLKLDTHKTPKKEIRLLSTVHFFLTSTT